MIQPEAVSLFLIHALDPDFMTRYNKVTKSALSLEPERDVEAASRSSHAANTPIQSSPMQREPSGPTAGAVTSPRKRLRSMEMQLPSRCNVKRLKADFVNVVRVVEAIDLRHEKVSTCKSHMRFRLNVWQKEIPAVSVIFDQSPVSLGRISKDGGADADHS